PLGGARAPTVAGVAPAAPPERPTLKKMRRSKFFVTFFVLSIAPQIFGCGYYQEEWDQKVRETEELRNDLEGEKSARAKAEADYADALEEIDALRAKLMESGVNVDSLSANLEAQQKALAEYQRRMDHLGQIR